MKKLSPYITRKAQARTHMVGTGRESGPGFIKLN